VRPLITGTLRWDPAVGTVPIGAWAELRRVVTSADVASYAALLGDDNPLHLDAAFAATTHFKRPIAHGMFSTGLIPTIFGATIPASVYVSQTFRFLRPVYVGDAIVARIEVTGVTNKAVGRTGARHPFLTCQTSILLEATGKVAVEGQAETMLPALK
jgi:3-hydroxybutyryl-CoA dehydratase